MSLGTRPRSSFVVIFFLLFSLFSGHSFAVPATSAAGMIRLMSSVINNPAQLEIIKTGSGNGTVTSDPIGIQCGSDCLEEYDVDTVVTLTATPDVNSVFVGWSGDPDCSDSIVTMDSNKTCTATFILMIFDLTVTTMGSGSGTVTTDKGSLDWRGNTGTASYTVGTVVTLSAEASPGSAFMSWGGDTDCTDGIVTMNGHTTCTATFSCMLSFMDIPPGFWAEEYILKTACSDIASGYPDGYYKPANSVIRA